ncbi:MAG: cytochrome-c oxidase, cbb3-type subunit III [Aestuariivirga sp.]
MADLNDIDEVSGVETTGHSWDGIKELNNPLPRWWLWTFYLCILFSIGYVIAYPAIPGLHGASKGVLGWSSRAEFRNEIATFDATNADTVAKIKSSSITDILANEQLRTFAVAAGASTFKVRCATCHGSGAQGSSGFPNLNDNDWLWGGKPDVILQTITHGIRDPSDKETRISQMPAFGHDGILKPEEIVSVANFVRQISKQTADAAQAATGAKIFADNCAACHGDKGQGNRDFGAPKLSDAIWLYKGDFGAIEAQVTNPRQGMMPAWGSKLGEVSVKELAAYVHSLGGGE